MAPPFRIAGGRVPGSVFAGAKFDYTIRWFGLLIPWKSRITEYTRGRFLDERTRNGGMTWLPLLTFGLSCAMGWAGLTLARRRWQDGQQRIIAFSCGTGNTGFFTSATASSPASPWTGSSSPPSS